jgi:phosphopantothenoylcysteine decarboxylase / phosphopantothenate---cysteine ligase
LELEPTPDVLAGLASRRRDGQTLIGFAAEHGPRALDSGREKLTAKGLDAIVVNDISRTDIGFDTDANEVTIIIAAGEDRSPLPGHTPPGRTLRRAASEPVVGRQIGERHVPRASKAEVAETILDTVEHMRAAQRLRAAR